MKLYVSGKSLQVVENDDVALFRLSGEVTKECDHSRPLHEITTA
ncbi:hypothetical protein RWK44_05375 [Rhizobium sp. 25PS6]|nr:MULTISPECIES: hypothetical protein [Rhizobium]MDU0359841.1 hypothetical protein [Rhizobium sp. 25PS6]